MSDTHKPHVAFDYIKSASFRVVHVDGAIGSPTPNGHLHVAVYSERPAIPRRIVHVITPDGKLGPDLPDLADTRGSIVREVETSMIMNIDVAKALRDWLSQQIDLVSQDNPKEV